VASRIVSSRPNAATTKGTTSDDAPDPTARYFCVARDYPLPNGSTIVHDRISRRIDRRGILMRVLKRVRRWQSDAYAIEIAQFR